VPKEQNLLRIDDEVKKLVDIQTFKEKQEKRKILKKKKRIIKKQ
jgi:hypothetical protein